MTKIDTIRELRTMSKAPLTLLLKAVEACGNDINACLEHIRTADVGYRHMTKKPSTSTTQQFFDAEGRIIREVGQGFVVCWGTNGKPVLT